MDEQTWSFTRAEQQLDLRRTPTVDGFLLEIVCEGPPRSFFFSDIAAISVFQSDMEAFLLKTGWSFVGFCPERRAGGDRRGWPRMSERRDWWTDGQDAPPPEQPAPKGRDRKHPRP